MRQIYALIFGIAMGLLSLQGFVPIAGFFVSQYLLSSVYSQRILDANEDDFPNQELLTEGLMNGFAQFMLTWIVTYTFAY